MSGEREIKIALTGSEALVLFELLSRYSNSKIDRRLTVLDVAERQALWNLLGCFERVLPEPFSPKYSQLLAAAKSDLTYQDTTPFHE